MIMVPGSPFSYHKAVVDACLPFFVVFFLMFAAVLFGEILGIFNLKK